MLIPTCLPRVTSTALVYARVTQGAPCMGVWSMSNKLHGFSSPRGMSSPDGVALFQPWNTSQFIQPKNRGPIKGIKTSTKTSDFRILNVATFFVTRASNWQNQISNAPIAIAEQPAAARGAGRSRWDLEPGSKHVFLFFISCSSFFLRATWLRYNQDKG